MVLFNYATKELTAKVVYYGPGLCGKTTNLQHIYDSLPEQAKGKMLSLATKTDRTLFFDFLPIDLGTIRGMKTKIQLYTVPGQVFYDTTRKLVLKGADGVVFVADSQEAMLDANLDSFENLITNLREQNLDIENMPHVIQFNKRDMKNVLPVEVLDARLNKYKTDTFEAIAPKGDGVFETLKGISKLVLKNLGQRYGLEEDNRAKAAAAKAAAAKSAASKPAAPTAAAAKAAAAPKPAPPKPTPPKAAAPAPTPARATAPAPAKPLSPHPASNMDEIEFIEDDTIEKAGAAFNDDEDIIDFDDDAVDLDNSAFLADSPTTSKPPANKGLEPLPNLDDSEVIELDDMDPLEVDELDDMAEIASMAGTSAKPLDVTPAQKPEPIEVPIDVNLPASLGGKPIRLQINITFED